MIKPRSLRWFILLILVAIMVTACEPESKTPAELAIESKDNPAAYTFLPVCDGDFGFDYWLIYQPFGMSNVGTSWDWVYAKDMTREEYGTHCSRE